MVFTSGNIIISDLWEITPSEELSISDNWSCLYCNSINEKGIKCVHCGAPKK
jgi:hypothetical protein